MRGPSLLRWIVSRVMLPHHRGELLGSEACAYFGCLATFPPSAVEQWTDAGKGRSKGDTALCPRCGVDSLIGSESGYPVTQEFLRTMQSH